MREITKKKWNKFEGFLKFAKNMFKKKNHQLNRMIQNFMLLLIFIRSTLIVSTLTTGELERGHESIRINFW